MTTEQEQKDVPNLPDQIDISQAYLLGRKDGLEAGRIIGIQEGVTLAADAVQEASRGLITALPSHILSSMQARLQELKKQVQKGNIPQPKQDPTQKRS